MDYFPQNSLAKRLARKLRAQDSKDISYPQSLDDLKTQIHQLKLGTGIQIYNKQSNRGYFIENLPQGYDSSIWKVGYFPDGGMNEEIEDEESLNAWLAENVGDVLGKYDTAQIYQVVHPETGEPIKPAPFEGDDQDVGDYERYGPDPIRPEF